MDSAVVLIEANGGTPLPRRLSVLRAECDLFWRGAGPYCYYCKGAGHWVTACERLAKRKQRSKKTSSSQPGPLQPPVSPKPPPPTPPPPPPPPSPPLPYAHSNPYGGAAGELITPEALSRHEAYGLPP